MLKLSFGLDFADLHQRDGLARLDEQFLHFIAASDTALRDALLAARAAPEALAPKAESELLIALAGRFCRTARSATKCSRVWLAGSGSKRSSRRT